MTPSTPPGDAAVVFDRLKHVIANPPSQGDAIDAALTEVSAHINELHAEIARLREREAQLERENDEVHQGWINRTNRAEARVKEAERELQKVQAFSTVQAQFIIDFQARVKELEEALRELERIAIEPDELRIIRRVLAHEEEATE